MSKQPTADHQADTPKTPRSPGRPALYADNAARQKAYRARKKAAGLREIHVFVRDVRGDLPLTSDVIDLSAVRKP